MSELVERLKLQAQERMENTSLSVRIRQTRLARGFKSEGLDQLLDLTPLDQSELIIFCRKGSLLSALINEKRKSRSPDELVKAMMLAAAKGYCRTCYELVKNCTCSEVDREWV